jgi:hypothetical protein
MAFLLDVLIGAALGAGFIALARALGRLGPGRSGLADVSYMPVWCAAACIGFDVVLAAYLVGRARGRLAAPGYSNPAPAG